MAGLGLTYAVPPASFETTGQKVRLPSAVVEGGLATCLDTAVLFAAALEQAGLHPIVVLTRGHALVGVWLQPQQLAQVITEDDTTLPLGASAASPSPSGRASRQPTVGAAGWR